MKSVQPNAQAAMKLSFSPLTPAPRYFEHNIIDPIMQRLAKSPSIDLNYCKKGHPEDGSVEYYIFASNDKNSQGLQDPFSKVARSECMRLKIQENGDITLSHFIPTRFGRKPYGEITADPKNGNTPKFRSLLNTFIYEVGRYSAEPSAEITRRNNKTIRHLVFRENPLNIRPVGSLRLAAE